MGITAEKWDGNNRLTDRPSPRSHGDAYRRRRGGGDERQMHVLTAGSVASGGESVHSSCSPN